MRATPRRGMPSRRFAPELKVGLTLSLHDFSRSRAVRHWPPRSGPRNLPTICPTSRTMIFLGVQNYTRTRWPRWPAASMPEGAELTKMGYEFYPQAAGQRAARRGESFQ